MWKAHDKDDEWLCILFTESIQIIDFLNSLAFSPFISRFTHEVEAVVKTSAFYPDVVQSIFLDIDYGLLTLLARALCW